MKLIIHDLDQEQARRILPAPNEDCHIIDTTTMPKPCRGCFHCWIKTPGQCIIPDAYQNMGALIGRSRELILISSCLYGCESPAVKMVLDRSIGYMLPLFHITRNEMHHLSRYPRRLRFRVLFYGGAITEMEKATASRLIKAQALNLKARFVETRFFTDMETIKEAL